MRRARVRAPAPGTVLGGIALIVALAGTAVALPGKKQIDKNDLRPNVVKSKHIAPNTVVGADVNEASLGQVPTAVTATDSGTVDGHDASCPAATVFHAGLCFDSADRGNSDWTGAIQDCADEGGYMPSPSELMSIRGLNGVDLGGTNAGTWADARYQDAGVNEAMTVLDNGALEGVALAGPRIYRCAFKLVR
ncbi:MAG: hypothetical protein FJW90_09540 [Actinobacteria bacterium]|nr:hypothetical protein [Actinomycetota bacterium]